MNARNRQAAEGAVSGSVRSLLEKRSTFRAWLVRLDELGGQYRPEVAERVRADYEARLGEVARELEGHRGALETSLTERRTVREEIGRRFEEESAQIEEIELRFQVGELDEATWTTRRQERAAVLETIQAELDAAAGSVEELETVLADLDGSGGGQVVPPPESVPVVAEPIAEAVVEAVVEESSAEPVEVESEPAERPGGQEDDFLDELEFLESLSLEDSDSFDAVSRMLEEEETTEGEGSRRADR